MTIRLTNAAASAMAGDGSSAGLSGYIGSGAKIKFYKGAVNTTPESAPAGTLLATLTVSGTFGTATNGQISTSSIGSASAVASDTPGSWMLFKSDGTTPICDGTVTAVGDGGDITFDNITWIEGGTVSMSSLALTEPPH